MEIRRPPRREVRIRFRVAVVTGTTYAYVFTQYVRYVYRVGILVNRILVNDRGRVAVDYSGGGEREGKFSHRAAPRRAALSRIIGRQFRAKVKTSSKYAHTRIPTHE